MKFAMRLSFIVGFFILAIKLYAFFATGSAAVLSDAAESVIHVVAVAFAAYSLSISLKPADDKHLYGKSRISFFSAGFEGILIIGAALLIIYESISRWFAGLSIHHLDVGLIFTLATILVNGSLGLYLIKKGKKHNSLVLEANGKHVFTDCLTSVGVIVALGMVYLTGWLPFDPIIAICMAINILWTGGGLLKKSIAGLMDAADSDSDKKIKDCLIKHNVVYHNLKHRYVGDLLLIEFHILLPGELSVTEAHNRATAIENLLKKEVAQKCDVLTHIEPLETHDEAHEN